MTKQILLIACAALASMLLIMGIRVGLLVNSISSYKKYWQKEATKAPEANALTYIALGDSAAQGVGATSARRGYVGLTAQHIARVKGKPVHIINLSVSGAKIEDALKTQLPQLLKYQDADYVTIEIGANDIATYDKDKFRKEFSELLNKLPKGTFVANMPSFHGGRAGKYDDNASNASKLIAELMIAYPDLQLVDVNEVTSTQNILDFGADLFHPSNSGYKNWARAFNKAIDKTL